MSQNWRIIDIINWGKSFFSKRNFENPKAEIEWLLCSLFKCNRLDIYMRFEEPLDKAQLIQLRLWVKRRSLNEPLQYITETCEFYGRQFLLSPKVLIPRPETERMIDVTLNLIKKKSNLSILDIGTGSGCIAVTMGLENPSSNVLGIDCCHQAKEVAEKNRVQLQAENVKFFQMDILKTYPKNSFDYVLSNPPYIAKNEFPLLMKDVKDFEPKIALTDFDDGLKFYNRYAEIGHELLKKEGVLILEVGLANHPKRVQSIFENAGYKNLTIFDDYNGDPRIMVIKV